MERSPKRQTTNKQLVPVLPEWCDYNAFTPKQKIIFIGAIRAILSLIGVAACVAYLCIYESRSATTGLVCGIIISSIIHCFVSLYFIYAAQAENPRRFKLWLILDIIFSVATVILIIVVLCFVERYTIHYVLGTKLIIIQIWLCFSFGRSYIKYLEMHKGNPYSLEQSSVTNLSPYML